MAEAEVNIVYKPTNGGKDYKNRDGDLAASLLILMGQATSQSSDEIEETPRKPSQA